MEGVAHPTTTNSNTMLSKMPSNATGRDRPSLSRRKLMARIQSPVAPKVRGRTDPRGRRTSRGSCTGPCFPGTPRKKPCKSICWSARPNCMEIAIECQQHLFAGAAGSRPAGGRPPATHLKRHNEDRSCFNRKGREVCVAVVVVFVFGALQEVYNPVCDRRNDGLPGSLDGIVRDH